MKKSRRFSFKSLFVLLLFSLPFWRALGAPCCSRNASIPVIITGDDEAQVSFGTSMAGVVAEVFDEGIPLFSSKNTSEIIQAFRLEGAMLLSDRLQAGVGLPLVNYRYSSPVQTSASTGIGDIRVSGGYELLPQWSYSEWKPNGFLFSVVTIPTGRSQYESQTPMSTDVTGNGFLSVSFGSIFLKRWTLWDVFFVSEVHYSFSREFGKGNDAFWIEPGFGGSMGVGVGFSPGASNLRIGFRVQPRLDQARILSSIDKGSRARGMLANCDTSLDFAYMVGNHDTIMVSYTDQTLLGPAMNLPLSRIVGINFQHRWER